MLLLFLVFIVILSLRFTIVDLQIGFHAKAFIAVRAHMFLELEMN